MALKRYRIDEFLGIDQSREENGMHPGMSPDACNMDTDNGALSVAKGYVRHIQAPVPGAGTIHRLHVFAAPGGDRFIAAAGDSIYAYDGSAWQTVYTYSPALSNPRFDFAQAQINGTDYLLIGCGERQMVKYDGTSASLFGSAANVSDIHALYLAMYRGRLFAAGDGEHPNRLYWSQLPGSGRSIEAWGPVEASPNVEGGHTEVGSMASDPIIGLKALSNQLLIFKKHSVYRLLGEKPGNFIIEEVDSRTERAAYTAVVKCGDALYYLTAGGLCLFNGVSAQVTGDARRIRTLLQQGDVSASRGALCRDKLYFTLKLGQEDAVIEYDLTRRVYMLRKGFAVADLCARDGVVYLVDGARRVCRFQEGASYDGAPVEAWWRTPRTDLADKGTVKGMRALYLRGKADEKDSATLVDVEIGGCATAYRVLLPREESDVLEVELQNEGRTFALRFYNEAGGGFALTSGVELEFETRRRTR